MIYIYCLSTDNQVSFFILANYNYLKPASKSKIGFFLYIKVNPFSPHENTSIIEVTLYLKLKTNKIKTEAAFQVILCQKVKSYMSYGVFIERSPVTVTAKEAEPYVLECDTPWRPNDQISWYKNEVPLQLNRPGAPAQMENNLVFRTIRPTDRGKYTCTVNNNLQTATTILLDTG